MPPKRSILILFAHPALEKSRVNRKLVEAVANLDGVTFHDLYETYPDFHIDVRREQALLLQHDLLVFQHPFYWYSAPALLKEWIDLVLEHGWAYDTKDMKLRGKEFLSAITTGGRERAYQRNGYNHFTMKELLAPFEQTANTCAMTWLPPFIVHGTHQLDEAAIEVHGEDYRRILIALRKGPLDPQKTRGLARLNEDPHAW
ncbi:MAG: NAD(P)H oxidoreductase [Proteobacteria bacterium]|nr:NAD(P)H oxidoreductase [Pseudomonadota bacterium]